jgi:hypothetical protein
MESKQHTTGDISDKLRIGFDRARLKFLEEEAKTNGVVIVSDKQGNIKKIPAKDLLTALKNSGSSSKK